MNRGAWWVTVHGSQRVWHDWVTDTYLCDGIESMNSHIGTDTAQQPMPDTGTKVYMTLPVHEQRSTPAWHFSWVQFSRSVVSDSLQPHVSQYTRPSCPSPTPGVYPNSCPSSQWYHPAISSSVVPFSSCPQSLPASGFFSNESTLHMRWPKYWVSASASVLSMNIQDWSPLGWNGWISLQSKGLSRVFSNTTVQKPNT